MVASYGEEKKECQPETTSRGSTPQKKGKIKTFLDK